MPPKRALGDDDAALLRDMTSNAAPPRGRKRFAYDLRNASESAAQGVEVCGARLSGTSAVNLFPTELTSFGGPAISPGEEDGSFDCVITLPDGMPQITVSVLVSGSWF